MGMPLILNIPEKKGFDSESNRFVETKATRIQLEHSLVSLKKWEQKWHIPFLDKKKDKSTEQWIDYIRCMTTTQNVDDDIYKYLTVEEIQTVVKYIEDPMTATWFGNNQIKGAARNSNEVITAEIIYYWMITLGVPVEFEKWHLNQLLTLIRVINIKNNPKKMGRREMAMSQHDIVAKRRSALHTKG